MGAEAVLFVAEAKANLYLQGAGYTPTGVALWFGALIEGLEMNAQRETFPQASTGARGITTYQGNTIHTVAFRRVWSLPTQSGPDRQIMTEFRPPRNTKYILQLAWTEELTKLQHQRIYYNFSFNGDNLNSKGALQFSQTQSCTATWMKQSSC